MKSLLFRLYPYTAWSALFFATGILIGVILMVFMPDDGTAIVQDLEKFVDGLSERTAWEMFLFIFLNNTVKAFAAAFLGFLFGIIPFMFLVGNGIAVGAIVVFALDTHSWPVILALLVPHGIIEVPALFLATGIGFMFGVYMIRHVIGREHPPLVPELINALRFFGVVLVPLFVLAAVLEVFVTPPVAAAVSFVIEAL